jgi:hypothetical protein
MMGVKLMELTSLELSAPPNSGLGEQTTENYAKVKIPQVISPNPGEVAVVGVKKIPIWLAGMMACSYRLSVTVGTLDCVSGLKLPMWM